MSTNEETQKTTGGTGMKNKTSQGFSDAEKAAMKERAKELKAEERASKNKAEGENAALAAIAAMPEPDRSMAAYADKDGNVICFFQNAQKFNARYSTLGFSDKAKLDEGVMWPSSFALVKLTAEAETRIIEQVRKAVG